jgi:hypothetical protein
MQTVQFFDGARDYAFAVTDVAPRGSGFEVVVKGDPDRHQHRFSVQQDDDGSLRVTHGSSPQVQVRLGADRLTDRLRATFAEDGDDDVSGHAVAPVLS